MVADNRVTTAVWQKVVVMKDQFEKEKAEAVRDALSKHNLPVENKAPEHNTFFNPDKIDETLTPAEKDRHSREEFASGWNEA